MARESVTQLVYLFLREYIGREGYPPTYREIATGIGYSTESVRKAVKALVEEGLITMKPRQWRSIKLVNTDLMSTPLRVLFFIQTYTEVHGKAPAQHEIATGLKLSNTTVTVALRVLKRYRRIDVLSHQWRGIRVIKPLGVTK